MRDSLDSDQLAQRWELAAVLASRLAHDLANILTGVNGFSELALFQLSQEHVARPHVRDILLAGQRGIELSQRLHLLRSVAKNQPARTAVAPVLAQVESRLRSNLPQGLHLNKEIATELPRVAMAPESLEHVLDELLRNAIEACGNSGNVRVTASSTDLTAEGTKGLVGSAGPGPHVELRIHDSGPGIAPDVRAKLLEVPMVTTKPGHRGLGLAIVFRVLYANRAAFSLSPGPQGGTIARICLPVA